MALTTVLFPWATWPMVPMLIVAWREMISGDSGFSVVRSRVLGSGCSLVRVSYAAQSLMSSTPTEALGARRAPRVPGPSSSQTLASSPQSPRARTCSRHRGGRGRIRTPCWAAGCEVWGSVSSWFGGFGCRGISLVSRAAAMVETGGRQLSTSNPTQSDSNPNPEQPTCLWRGCVLRPSAPAKGSAGLLKKISIAAVPAFPPH